MQALARRRVEAQRFIVGYLREHPCLDCGETDLVVLEFDHLRDKRHDVSVLVAQGASSTRLLREIEKCEVVCVNCHRQRTAGRRGSWRCRLDMAWFAGLQPAVARNLRHVLQILELAQCQDCAEPDIVVLDFGHVGPKRGSVIELAFAPCRFDALKQEIAECEIRCANCHKKRTASVRGFYRQAA